MTIDGSLKGRFGGQGTVAHPRLSGSISADRLSFAYPEQGIYLKDGRLRATLQDDALVLEQSLLRGGAGSISGSGALAWESGEPSAQPALKADKLELVRRLNRHLILSGNGAIKFEHKLVQANAKLKADSGEIELPAADTPTLSSDVVVLGRGMEGASRNDLALLQTAASALLARGDSIPLQSRIAHAAGLDEVSLAGSGGLESTALTLGKRLSSRAYLTFEQGLATATHLMKINYTLTPRLSLRAQAGTESAVDAFYTFSFK